MHRITISLDDQDYNALEADAKKKGIPLSDYAAQIVHKSIISHNIDYEDMAKGYESMADINIELSGGSLE